MHLNRGSQEGQAFSGGASAGARACVQGSAAAASGRRVVSGQFWTSRRCAGAGEESRELRADGEPVGAGGQRAPAGLPGARPGTGTHKASAKARSVGSLPPRRKAPNSWPCTGHKGHVCPPDRNTTPLGPQTARARTQETPVWPKHSKRTVNELKKRLRLRALRPAKGVFGQSLGRTTCDISLT